MAKDLEVAILFADVVGSTQLYDEYGDTKASETVAHCLDVMKDATHQFNGTVIKTIGDEVMATFPTVDDAMAAASQMQGRISSEGEGEKDHIPVSIRIGCHYGPVVQEHNDIFGAAVHTANRMTSQAKARQIVISGTDAFDEFGVATALHGSSSVTTATPSTVANTLHIVSKAEMPLPRNGRKPSSICRRCSARHV